MFPTRQIDSHQKRGQTAAEVLNEGHPLEALKILKSELDINPNDGFVYYNTGLAYHHLKDYDQAVIHYQKAISLLPRLVQAHHNLGQAYAAQQNTHQAVRAYQNALHIDPEDFNSAFNLSLLLRNAGAYDEAVKAIQIAIAADPNSAEAFCFLARIYLERNRTEESLVCIDQSLRINAKLTEAHYNKGVVLQKTGAFENSLTHFRNAIACDASFAPARWLYELSLPMMYEKPEEIDHYRNRFRTNLDGLIESIPLESDNQKAFALRGVQSTTNFYLQYQCRNDLDLQQKYGRFAHKIMTANYPQWARKKKMPPLGSDRKIRIGYVSTFMHDHTVGIFLTGWLENHTQDAFDIHCYHLGKKVDHVTEHLRRSSHHFHHFFGEMEAAAEQICKDHLHILIYTDIGMDPITTQLAALRLAPIQCKGWGHPVTTGLPTIDYYLSSDLMEPKNAQVYYSETLVRLPNLALCYRPPPLPQNPKNREMLDIPQDRFVYLSTQSIFKYLPQHDDIYPRIASAVPQSCFVFIGHQSGKATARFYKRLKSAFAKFGLNSDHYCIFSKKLNFQDFLSLNLAADVLLDSMEWSGGKTTLEALTCGLPAVTLPGRFMRGRHTAAMLTMMDATGTIAENKSTYCEIAIRLGTDAKFYESIKTRIENNRHKLYHDMTFLEALEDFYRQAISQSPPLAHNANQTMRMSNY